MHRRVLGAVLAGGQSRRFGSDKAIASIDGRPMIDHVIASFESLADQVVVCGRRHGDLATVADRPAAGLGPLAGLNAALHYAAAHGFGSVVTLPCDTPTLDRALIAELIAKSSSAILTICPVIGAWPATLAPALDAYLATVGDRSIRAWAAHVGAERLDRPAPANVNHLADLALVQG